MNIPTKLCRACKQAVSLDGFHKLAKAKDGLQARCKACVCAYMKARNIAKADELREKSKAYYAANREERKAKIKEWQRVNAAVVSERRRESYLANREQVLERNRAYREQPDVRERYNAKKKENYELNKPERLRQGRLYRRTPEGKAVLAKAHAREKVVHAEKIKARYHVSNAIRDGRLLKASACQLCNTACEVEAHHHKGYARQNWLNVQWLCLTCHKAEDKKQ